MWSFEGSTGILVYKIRMAKTCGGYETCQPFCEIGIHSFHSQEVPSSVGNKLRGFKSDSFRKRFQRLKVVYSIHCVHSGFRKASTNESNAYADFASLYYGTHNLASVGERCHELLLRTRSGIYSIADASRYVPLTVLYKSTDLTLSAKEVAMRDVLVGKVIRWFPIRMGDVCYAERQVKRYRLRGVKLGSYIS